MQRVNTAIFNPQAQELLKRVLLKVTSFLKSKGVKTLDFVAYEAPWRLYSYYGDCTVNEVVVSPLQAYDIGRAFAKFHNDLSDFPPPRLEEVLPKFHDTLDRLKALDEALSNDAANRAALVQRELKFIEKRRAQSGRIVSLIASGEIPERVIHNDSKINNLLFLPDGTAVVIDLDTVMPGLAMNDFGDAVRFGASTAAEDEKDLDKVWCDMELFDVYAKGFIEGCDGKLTAKEIESLPMGAKVMTYECGMRFLTDYLQGDVYFKVHREGHNLDRTRTHIKLIQDMETKWDIMNDIVKKYNV